MLLWWPLSFDPLLVIENTGEEIMMKQSLSVSRIMLLLKGNDNKTNAILDFVQCLLKQTKAVKIIDFTQIDKYRYLFLVSLF